MIEIYWNAVPYFQEHLFWFHSYLLSADVNNVSEDTKPYRTYWCSDDKEIKVLHELWLCLCISWFCEYTQVADDCEWLNLSCQLHLHKSTLYINTLGKGWAVPMKQGPPWVILLGRNQLFQERMSTHLMAFQYAYQLSIWLLTEPYVVILG
jgi:hypothetical protein